MRQKTKNNLRITLLVLFLMVLIGITIFFIIRQTVFQQVNIGVYQIVTQTTETGDIYTEQPSAKINTGINIFEFANARIIDMATMGLVTGDGRSDTNHYPILEMEVYKDNVKISKLTSLITCGDVKMTIPGCNYPNQMYQITNTSYFFNDDAGTRIHLQMQVIKNVLGGAWFDQWYNFYQLKLSNKSFDVFIVSAKDKYIQGETLTFNITVDNKLKVKLTGELSVLFETTTILGKLEKRVTQNILLLPGKNSYNVSLLTTTIPGKLNVTPEFKLFMYGDNFVNLNYNNLKINSSSLILIGTIEKESVILSVSPNITGTEEYLKLITETAGLQKLIEEKAAYINSLNLELSQQGELIESLGLKAVEQAALINNLTSNTEEQSIIIKSMKLTQEEQANLITSLTSNIGEQATIINNLNLNLQQKIILIDKLNLETAKQAALINNLTSNIDEQSIIIKSMELTQEEQANLITSLTSNIGEQATIINNLNLNLQQKIILIDKLNIETAKQAQLINEMKLSFSEQADIINGLDLLISDDANLIKNLTSKTIEQAEIIKNLNLNIEDMSKLISEMNLKISEQATIINNLNLNVDEKAKIIAGLNLLIKDDANLIKNLTSKTIEQAEIIKNLNLNVEDMSKLIGEMNLKISEQVTIINNLNLNLDEKAKIIAGLNLSLDNEKKLVSDLGLNIDEQKELLNKIGKEKSKFPSYLWFVFGGILIVIVLIFLIFKFSKKKR